MADAGELVVVFGAQPAVARFLGAAPELLRTAHPRVRVEIAPDAARFAELVGGADGVIVSGFPIPPSAFGSGGRLRWVQSVHVGVDGLLTPELAAARHVAVTASKGPMAEPIAEHDAMLLLALARGLPRLLRDQADHRWISWADRWPNMAQLSGRTIAVLGVGQLGGALARICRAGSGMRVLGMSRSSRGCPHVDRYFGRGELHAALGEADAIALTMPATAETTGILDAAALAAVKPGAFLVNVARGKLVDEAALIEALRSGRIAGAGLDTTAVEPLPPESPLWTMPNVIVTAHLAPMTDRMVDGLVAFWIDNVRRFAEGQPLRGAVDREAGY